LDKTALQPLQQALHTGTYNTYWTCKTFCPYTSHCTACPRRPGLCHSTGPGGTRGAGPFGTDRHATASWAHTASGGSTWWRSGGQSDTTGLKKK